MLFYSLGQAGPHFFVFLVAIPEILSKKNGMERGVIRSNMDLSKKKLEKKTFFKAKNHLFQLISYQMPNFYTFSLGIDVF